MIKSITRSGIVTSVNYRNMLAGNSPYYPVIASTYFADEGFSTQINKMPFATEAFSALSATLTFSGYSHASAASGLNGYAFTNGASNKFFFGTDTNATLATILSTTTHTYIAGHITDTSGIVITNPGTLPSNHLLNTLAFSNDTFTTSTALQSVVGTNIGLSPYTLNTDGTNVYFGGGAAAGTYYHGGVVKYFSATNTASLTYTDVNSRARANTAGANNGSTAGYIAGGSTMPYVTYTNSIMKMTYSTDTLTTISGTLTVLRSPIRTGMQKGVCAYYGGGKSSTASNAVSVTTVEKFVFSTETSSNLASASVNRDGVGSWNTASS